MLDAEKMCQTLESLEKRLNKLEQQIKFGYTPKSPSVSKVIPEKPYNHVEVGTTSVSTHNHELLFGNAKCQICGYTKPDNDNELSGMPSVSTYISEEVCIKDNISNNLMCGCDNCIQERKWHKAGWEECLNEIKRKIDKFSNMNPSTQYIAIDKLKCDLIGMRLSNAKMPP